MARVLWMSGLPETARFLAWVSAFSEQDQIELCVPEIRTAAGNVALALYQRYADQSARASETDRMMYCDAMVRLPECMLTRTDRMTMAVSLEGRTPFLDYRVVEWAMRLPGHLKVYGNREKYILKSALSGVVPPEILGRRKQGLAVPFAQWTRYGVERHIRRLLSRDRVKRRGLFVPDYVEGLLDHWGPHASRHSQLIWSLLCLELWCRIYLDRELDPATPLSQVS
jgi:asparagine synthase (glutamine-hydrolysing)